MTNPEFKPPFSVVGELAAQSELHKAQLETTLAQIGLLMFQFKEGDEEDIAEVRKNLLALPLFETLKLTDKTKLENVVSSLNRDVLNYEQKNFGAASFPSKEEAIQILQLIIDDYHTA